MLAHTGQSVASVTMTPPHLPRTTVRHGPEAARPHLVGCTAFLAFGGAANLFSIACSLRDESWLCSSLKGSLGPIAAWHTASFRPLLSRYSRFDWDERIGAIGPSTEFGLKKPIAFSTIPMRACSLIRSTPRESTASSSSV